MISSFFTHICYTMITQEAYQEGISWQVQGSRVFAPCSKMGKKYTKWLNIDIFYFCSSSPYIALLRNFKMLICQPLKKISKTSQNCKFFQFYSPVIRAGQAIFFHDKASAYHANKRTRLLFPQVIYYGTRR